ncbi:MAG: class I SAM-dependent methyltransferase [Solibacillus sp.]|uniref:class I SAM-dependent methyltransferase n=1 Tax=unclassified Solibacillus TaxID=2637870 RepID=UPI0030FCBD27
MNEQQYEKHLNINTSGFQYGFPKLVQYHRYEPTPYSGLDQLFEHYELPPNAHFLDIGCGKGRVPIYIHHQFDIPVTGIEMDPKFFVEAEHNREQYLKKMKKKGASIRFINVLAENYEIKKQDNVFFFFNPFSVHVFRQFIKQIFNSIEKNPRLVDLILYYPSPEYIAYLQKELAVDFLLDVKLPHEKNENERIVVFRM